MSNSSINVVDILVLVIVLVSIFSAYKTGFTKLVLQKFSFFGGVICSFLFTSTVTTLVADAFDIHGKIVTFVTKHINEAKLFSTNPDMSALKGVTNLNKMLDEMSILGKFTAKALKELDVVSLIDKGHYKDELIKMIVDAVETPVMTIVNAVVFFVILLATMFIFSLLSGVINDIVNVIPLLGTTNHILGGLFGIINGLLWAVIFVVVYLLVCMFVTDITFISSDLVKSSIVGKFVLGIFSNIGL